MEEKATCPVCNSLDAYQEKYPHAGAMYYCNCTCCGKFSISYSVISNNNFIQNKNLAVLVSHWIRTHQKESHVEITSDTLGSIQASFFLPKPREQADNLILWLGNNVSKPDQLISIRAIELASTIGAFDEAGVFYIARELYENGLINGDDLVSNTTIRKDYRLKLKFKGWDRYYELQRSNKDSRLAFMAMKFGEEPLNTIYESVIKSAVDKTGFEIRKLDEEPKAGLIDDKLRVEIRRSKFLIADLSHDNNGAYWEAGFAEGLGMPVIYICEEEKFNDKTKTTHFDTNHHLTVLWKNEESGLKKFAEDLKATIRATLPAEARMDD